FCLSLMGADYPSFLSEAHRVLQPGGSLIIAEVRSRFDPTTGGAELKDFVGALKQLGFRLVSKDLSNKMFLLLFLEKVQAEVSDSMVGKALQPLFPHHRTMPPKGKSKVLPEALPLDASASSVDDSTSVPAPASSDPADKGKGKVDDPSNETLPEATASGSGLSLEEKLQSLRVPAPDSGFLEDDYDEELEVSVKTEVFNRVRYMAILLLPEALALEVASVITTVRTLMKRVWTSSLSDAASLPASPLITPILLDPAMVLISTGGNREEWICTQVGCGKAKGKSFMTAADHVTSANHLIHLEKLGSATRASLERASLNVTKKDYGI
ncbi:unnamed protein product, partial [Closterium sp. Yama58-4]